MSITKKRPYSSESRQQKAQLNRKSILGAAKKLFESKGFEKVKIEEIAAEAGVSAPSIYAIFQSKKGLLLALMDESYDLNKFEELVKKSKGEKLPKKKLMLSAKIARELYDAEKSELSLLKGASIVDPEFKTLEIERENRRYERQKETVQTLAAAGAFKKGIEVKEARDILWTMTGRDLYRLLVVERGWSSDQYENWVGETLIKSLLK